MTLQTAATVGHSLNDVDVIIVTHNSSAIISGCLASIASSCEPDVPATVTVVESSDGDSPGSALTRAEIDRWNQSDSRLGTVKFVSLGVNIGFGSAANRGAALSSQPFLAVLNPDIFMEPQCLQVLRNGLNNDAHLAAVGPAVLNPDGTLYPSARRFPNLIDAAGHAFVGTITPRNPWTRRYVGRSDHAEWISGTAMLIRRTDFHTIGGFDEGYFMYVEDVDLCWRFAQHGRKVAQIEAARLIHTIGASSQQVPVKMILAHHRSLLRFARRTMPGRQQLALPVVALGLCARAALLIVLYGVRRRPSATLHSKDASQH